MVFRFWHAGAADPGRGHHGRRQAVPRPHRPGGRLWVEALEDRTLLSFDFNAALNLDTYPWVRMNAGDPLLPQAPPGQYNWTQARHPDSVAIADFNGDNIPDIAVTDFNSDILGVNEGEISVFLGSGEGSFSHMQPVVDLTTSPQTIRLLDSGGIAPSQIVTARLRGPGSPVDLIVVNRGVDGLGANISVLLGNGDGNFQAPQRYDVGLFPTAVAVGDFNNDGHPDLVIANRTIFPGTATILFGDGNGGFSGAQSLGLFDVSAYPESVAVGDFNGDGNLDFVTANSGSNNVTVVMGNGNGSFSTAVTYAVGLAPVSVAVADMNGDGKLDIITANNGSDDISILFGNGNAPPAAFDGPTEYPAGLTPTALVVGNFDGVGPEVAVTNGQDSETSSNTIAVLTHNPNPTQQPDQSDLLFSPSFFQAGQFPVALATAALRPNLPSVLDLVVANFGGTLDRGSVSIFRNDSRVIELHRQFRFFPTPGSFATGLQPDSVAAGDFNGDGLTDFVAANLVTNDLTVWLNDPTNPGFNFLPLTDPNGFPYSLDTLGINPKKVIVADFNGDGRPDIAVADFGDFGVLQGNVTIFLNTGLPNQPFVNDPQFYHFQFAAPDAYLLDMTTGDFNNDGKLDIAVLFVNALTNRTGVAVLFGTGDGSLNLGPDTLLPVGTNPTSLAAADFDNDGNTDLVVTNSKPNPLDSTLGVLFGDGQGNFPRLDSYMAGTNTSAVAVGRLRGNDQPYDIVVANENFPGGVTVFFNDGHGVFSKSGVYFAGTNPVALVIADLNGDGIPDIAAANVNGDSVSVIFGHADPNDASHGDGTFLETVAYVTGGFPTSIVAADFFDHRDGKLDLITADSASNQVSVLENIAAARTSGGGALLPAEGDLPDPAMNLGPAPAQDPVRVLLTEIVDAGTWSGQFDLPAIVDRWHLRTGKSRPEANDLLWTLLREEL